MTTYGCDLNEMIAYMQVARCQKLQHPFVLAILKKLIERSYPMLEVNVQVSTLAFPLPTFLLCGPSSPLPLLYCVSFIPAGIKEEFGGPFGAAVQLWPCSSCCGLH